MFEIPYEKAVLMSKDELIAKTEEQVGYIKEYIESGNQDSEYNGIYGPSNSYYSLLLNRFNKAINVSIDFFSIKLSDIVFDDVKKLIDLCNQIGRPLYLYIIGGTRFNSDIKYNLEMLFDDSSIKLLKELDEFLIENNQASIRFYKSISNSDGYWTLEEVISANESIDSIVNIIRKYDLSPYEVMAVLHKLITSSFEYCEDEEEPSNARSIVGVLNTDRIVCIGYSELAKAIIIKLAKEGLICDTIVSSLYYENYDIQYEFMPMDGINGHMQNLIYIKDDKYNIEGYYINDFCWDSKSKSFPNGKGYANFMFPVTDLEKYKDVSYTDLNFMFEDLLEDDCDITEDSISLNPIINKYGTNSKPIDLEKLIRCLNTSYKVFYKKEDQETIKERVDRAISVSKIVSHTIFSYDAVNCLAKEAYKDKE